MRTSPPPHAPANRTDGARHRPRALTVFAAAFIAGAAAAVGVNRVLDVRLAQLKPRVESESIFVALRSLPQGSPVTVWDVALRDWPKAMLPGTALRAQDSFAGMVLKHPLREGQPLLSVQLTPAETGRGPGDPTAAAAAPSFVQLETPAAATADLWTPAEPARPQPPAPRPTPVAAAPEVERPAKRSDTGPVTTPGAVPSVAGPTTPVTEPAGDPGAPPAADPARVPNTAGANDAAVAPGSIATPESRPQTVGPEPQAASLPTTVTEPRPGPATPAPAIPAPSTDQASAQTAPSTQATRPDAGPMPVDEASPENPAPRASPNAGGLAAETTPDLVTDDPATAETSAPLPQQAALTPAVEPVAPGQTVETQQPVVTQQTVVAEQPIVASAPPDVAPATVANDRPAQAAGPTVMVAEGRPTPADPDVTAPASEPQPAVVESVVAPPATASLPPAPVSQRSDAAAPRPTYPRYLVVPEKIALQADRSFAAPAPAEPQPSTPTPSQTMAAKQPQEHGDTAAVRPLPSTASASSGSARGQASPQGNPAPRQSRQPAPPRRGSTPPAETKPRIGAMMFPNLSNGAQSLEGRTQRQPSTAGSSTH